MDRVLRQNSGARDEQRDCFEGGLNCKPWKSHRLSPEARRIVATEQVLSTMMAAGVNQRVTGLFRTSRSFSRLQARAAGVFQWVRKVATTPKWSLGNVPPTAASKQTL